MRFFTKEVKIALVSIIGIVVLFMGLQFLKGLSIFSNDNSFYVAFDDATGLSESSPVYANGYRVGVVKELEYNYDPQGKIIAVIGLNKQMRVPLGSYAELASDLLGNIKINLVLSNDPLHMLSVGDTIKGSAEQGIMSKVGELMPTIEAIFPKLDSIMGSLNMLLGDPALHNMLHNVEGMTANLSAVDVAQMMAKVNQTLKNVEDMTNKLNSNEGTLGLLMRDASLYNNLTSTAADADSLLIDFKAHPRRYIQFSVFGKKDK